jgi:PTH1 family peptidyl-tRNA hydrolase
MADNATMIAKGEDAAFQNKVHLAMQAKGFGEVGGPGGPKGDPPPS